MKLLAALVFILLVVVACKANNIATTATRIYRHNYPVEVHHVITPDGYILRLFRIPYSHKLNNQYTYRPVVFLMHGFLGTSDMWILSGPDNAPSYLLADAGFDVWLGNTRGNTYCKDNIYVTSESKSFWNYTWDDIGVYDLPAMLDYILQKTQESSLHYIGHSQGVTTFLVLMSIKPEYNAKIKTSHLLAPVGFMTNAKSPLLRLAAQYIGKPSQLSELIGSRQFLPSKRFLMKLLRRTCFNGRGVQTACVNALLISVGWDINKTNQTMLPDIIETYPAGSSTGQFIHYLQLHLSKRFRRFDYGPRANRARYGQSTPPDYQISNVIAPVYLYYGASDDFTDVKDVLTLTNLLPNVVESILVPDPTWGHYDFIYSNLIRPLIHERLVAIVKAYENL